VVFDVFSTLKEGAIAVPPPKAFDLSSVPPPEAVTPPK